MKNKYLIHFVSITCILGVTACSGGTKKESASTTAPVTVTVTTVSTGMQQDILASGQVEAVQTAGISTRVMGRITNIYVKVGDRVNKGQILATISDEDIRAKRAQATAMIAEAGAAFTLAQKDLDRFTNLYKQQSATAKELDNVTLQYNAARARVDAAKEMRNEIDAMLSYSSLTAPFSGVVTQKLAETGNIANPGIPLLTIEQNGVLQVSATVSESDISHIRTGQAVMMTIKSTGENIQGKIIQINPSAQFTGGQYLVKIGLPVTTAGTLYAGMFVGVHITSTAARAEKGDEEITIPVAAVVHRDELTGVYTVSSGNTALLRWIRLGKSYGDKVEVLSGLSAGEQFITTASGKLFNGAPVKVN